MDRNQEARGHNSAPHHADHGEVKIVLVKTKRGQFHRRQGRDEQADQVDHDQAGQHENRKGHSGNQQVSFKRLHVLRGAPVERAHNKADAKARHHVDDQQEEDQPEGNARLHGPGGMVPKRQHKGHKEHHHQRCQRHPEQCAGIDQHTDDQREQRNMWAEANCQ